MGLSGLLHVNGHAFQKDEIALSRVLVGSNIPLCLVLYPCSSPHNILYPSLSILVL